MFGLYTATFELVEGFYTKSDPNELRIELRNWSPVRRSVPTEPEAVGTVFVEEEKDVLVVRVTPMPLSPYRDVISITSFDSETEPSSLT